MTRYTDFGRKRTHVQAGFEDLESAPVASTSALPEANASVQTAEEAPIAPPAKKKRKRTPKSKRDNYGQGKPASEHTGDGTNPPTSANGAAVEGETEKPAKKSEKAAQKAKAKLKRLKDAKARKSASEDRRQKRISERNADTTCLACREKGHLARDCPKTKNTGGPSKAIVGICYRCGSRKHSLSKCRAAVDPEKPLPFASCFVCNGAGHLSSMCPHNVDKGIYPNGGCCKLCGEVTHLAKNCGLRKDESNNQATLIGTGREAGADEDDFLIIGRKKREVERDEKTEERVRRTADVKLGALTGTVRAFGLVPTVASKKVVSF